MLDDSPVRNRAQLPPHYSAALQALKRQLQSEFLGQPILGSKLGGLAMRQLSASGGKVFLRDFGGLRQFALDNLSDVVKYQGRTEGQVDDVYSVISDTPDASAEHSGKLIPITEGTRGLLWGAISNPTSKIQVVVQPDGNLALARQGRAPETYPSLSPMTKEEYAGIIDSFVDTLNTIASVDVASKARTVLSGLSADGYHAAWIAFLKTQRETGIDKPWRIHRSTSVIQLFRTKARAAGASADAIAACIPLIDRHHKHVDDQATEDRAGIPPTQGAAPSGTDVTVEGSATSTSTSATLTQMQRMVIAIVSRMTDDQLRQLALPVGLVVEAGRQEN